MAAKGGHIDFIFLAPPYNRPLDPLLISNFISCNSKAKEYCTITVLRNSLRKAMETHPCDPVFCLKQDISVPCFHEMINPEGFKGIFLLHQVFTVRSPVSRGNFSAQVQHSLRFIVEENPVMTMDARLGYRDKGDPISNWTEIARSSEERLLKCKVQKVAWRMQLC